VVNSTPKSMVDPSFSDSNTLKFSDGILDRNKLNP